MENYNQKYIHYGNNVFDKNRVNKIVNNPFSTKPQGGLWASSADAKFSWLDWSHVNDYCECKKENSFTFALRPNAKVLTVNYLEDLDKLPKIDNDLGFPRWIYLDFETLAKEYDAIEVIISNDHRLYDALYGWDCDSILIFNPDIIDIL